MPSSFLKLLEFIALIEFATFIRFVAWTDVYILCIALSNSNARHFVQNSIKLIKI